MTGVHIYYPSGSRNNQQSKLTNNQPATESCRGEPTPLSTPDSVAASVLSVYAQTELSLSTRAGGSSARWVSADLEPRMTISSNSAHRTPFDTFDTYRRLVSNENSQDGAANLTHLTHLSTNRRGCTWRASAGARAAALGLVDTPPSVGVKSVKSVKPPTQSCDSSFTFGVKPGVNLTPSAVSGWCNE